MIDLQAFKNIYTCLVT